MNETAQESASTGSPGSTPREIVRVEKGQANAEELAAVTALLLARAAATSSADGTRASARHTRPSKAGWRRLERQHGFRAPHSWQG
ncbi:acyl-CoA carboxylase subunit epsilon [Streptomyces albus subsp. chlorinus]|uniref:acyl-CoA carboxylase epsilon subunit n=1 Tax=Streptomyces albus TaxID=1888 RepID=UPI0015711D97|nr:acyl-CoA carboxylase epsilon subunit [Streptomyces albus]NSC24099.1 acyl-CoA carboxylase subunit epsilon [Streptomyces albus subsp. chlorinus]